MCFCILRRNSIRLSKNGGKTIFGESRQQILQIPCGSKISLSGTVIEIIRFGILCRNWPPKMAGKRFLVKKCQYTLQIPCGSKNVVEIALSRTVFEINMFWRFTQKSKMATKNGRKMIFAVDSGDTLWVKNFVEFALSCTLSEINAFLCFTEKFKIATKTGGKTTFGKSRQ